MKRKRQTFYIALMVVVLVMTVFAVSAIADAGNFSGGSDYGGSGSYSGGYDYGGSYGDSGTWIFSSGDGSGSLGAGGWIFALVVVLVIFSFMKKKSAGNGRRYAAPARGANVSDYSQLRPIQTLRDEDPNFSEAVIKEKISNLYVRMQNAWQAKDFEPMRPHMTDALYSQFMLQLNELMRSGCTNHVERIAVLDVELPGWRSDETNDTIIAKVYTRIIDFTSNDKTGKVISGSVNTEKFMTYEWTLIRSKGMKTPAPSAKDGGAVTINCPNCGAPVEINQSARCPYCGSVIQAADYDWVISEIKGIAQKTGR